MVTRGRKGFGREKELVLEEGQTGEEGDEMWREVWRNKETGFHLLCCFNRKRKMLFFIL